MAVREVLIWPNPRLREVARPVDEVDASVRALIQDLFDTMYDENGAGLAATQLGVPLAVVVMDCGLDDPAPLALVNARIVEREGSVLWSEGCLSVPGVTAEVERSERIVVEHLNAAGLPCRFEATGLLAVCVQHELDHLDGRLYFDRLAAFERKATLDAFAQANDLEASG